MSSKQYKKIYISIINNEHSNHRYAKKTAGYGKT